MAPLQEHGFKYAQLQSASFLTSKGYIRRQKWADGLAVSATRLKSGQATSNSVITTVTTFAAQPDFARIISITPGGTTGDVAAGNISLAGTNIRDEVITEDVAILANASSAVYSTKAFKTLTSVVFPIQDGSGATYDIGITDGLGLDRCMDGNNVILITCDGVYETTRPTVTAHETDVSKNTLDPNTALNASRDFIVYFISNEIRKDA